MGSMESLSQGITTIQSLSTGPVNTSSTHIFTYSIISGLSRFSVNWFANIFGYLANLGKLLACCLWNIMWTDETGHTSLSEGWLLLSRADCHFYFVEKQFSTSTLSYVFTQCASSFRFWTRHLDRENMNSNLPVSERNCACGHNKV